MGKFSVDMPVEFLKKIDSLEKRRGEIFSACVEEGVKVAEKSVRKNLHSVLSPKEKNGELMNSLGITSVKQDRRGIYNAKVGFSEPRLDQGGSLITKTGKKRTYRVRTNSMIATVLEFGGRDGKQPARPFIATSKIQCEEAVAKAMSKKFDEEVSK